MRLLLILSALTLIKAAVINQDERCTNGVIINNVPHNPEIIKENLDRPYLLTVDHSTNKLFFSYSVNLEDDAFKTAHLDLNTNEFGDIQGVNNGFAQTVDEKTHDVYIGGSNGLYKYDEKTNTANLIGENDTDIWMVYYKNDLFYSVFPSQFLYTLKNGFSHRFEDLEDTKVDKLIIDDNGTIFFTNATGLYKQKKGTKLAVEYKEMNNVGIRGLTNDVKGEIYFCIQDGIYSVDKEGASVNKIVDIDDAFGLAFDKDNNIIYADAKRIVRLKAIKDVVCNKEVKDSTENEGKENK